jgi:uncharacterized membrane protein YfcA
MPEFLSFYFPVSGTETLIFIPSLVAFIISFFTSMAGISGAFLLLPFQMSVLGFSTPSVSSTNLLYNVTGTPGGVYRYLKEGRLVWPIAITIVSGIIPGVLIGYYLRVKYLPDPSAFKLFVGLVLMVVAFRLIREAWTNKTESAAEICGLNDKVVSPSIGFNKIRFDFKGITYTIQSIGLIMLSFAVGIISGIYGIGGGSIIAPFCIAFFRLPVHTIAGAVLLGTFTSSAAGVIFYSFISINGSTAAPDWALGILFGIGGLFGMYFGAKCQRYVPEKIIKIILALIILSIATKYILQFI